MQIDPKTMASRYAEGWKRQAYVYRNQASVFGLGADQRATLERLAASAENSARRWTWQARHSIEAS